MKPITEAAKLFGTTEEEILGIGRYGNVPEARHALCLALHKSGVKNKAIQKMTGWEQSRICKSLEIARRKNFEPEFNVKVYQIIDAIKDEKQN